MTVIKPFVLNSKILINEEELIEYIQIDILNYNSNKILELWNLIKIDDNMQFPIITINRIGIFFTFTNDNLEGLDIELTNENEIIIYYVENIKIKWMIQTEYKYINEIVNLIKEILKKFT